MLLLVWCSCSLFYLIMTHWLFFTAPWLDREVLWTDMTVKKIPSVDIGVFFAQRLWRSQKPKVFLHSCQNWFFLSIPHIVHKIVYICVCTHTYVLIYIYTQAHTDTHMILFLFCLSGTYCLVPEK